MDIINRCAIGLGLTVLAALAQAQTNPLQKGPDPTPALLNASSGPFAISNVSVSRFAASGFGGGTIYFPTTAGSYAALRYMTNSSSTTVRSRIDAARLGVAGHSMGGGGSLLAARDNPSLKAAVPLTGWSTTKNFSTVRVPTLVVGAENDSVASVAAHSIPFYTSLASTLDKAYAELNDADHFAPNSTNTPIGRYSVSWVKRFMDNDTRYEPFLCGAPHAAFATATVFSDYRSTCPY